MLKYGTSFLCSLLCLSILAPLGMHLGCCFLTSTTSRWENFFLSIDSSLLQVSAPNKIVELINLNWHCNLPRHSSHHVSTQRVVTFVRRWTSGHVEGYGVSYSDYSQKSKSTFSLSRVSRGSEQWILTSLIQRLPQVFVWVQRDTALLYS